MSDTPADELRARITEAAPDRNALARWLDERTHDERVSAVRGMGRSDQRRLWKLSEGFAPVNLNELVPADVDGGATVRHFGKNTLPAFTHFEKRFCRPEGEDREKPERLFGFNFQSTAWATGPGYFTAVSAPGGREVWIDYRSVPDAAPEGWPAVRINERGLSRFVYGFMVDTLRRVSRHVTIGSAARRGRDMGSWFLLAQEPTPGEGR